MKVTETEWGSFWQKWGAGNGQIRSTQALDWMNEWVLEFKSVNWPRRKWAGRQSRSKEWGPRWRSREIEDGFLFNRTYKIGWFNWRFLGAMQLKVCSMRMKIKCWGRVEGQKIKCKGMKESRRYSATWLCRWMPTYSRMLIGTSTKGKVASRQSLLHEGAHRQRRPRTRASVEGRRSLLPAGDPEKLETEPWRAQSSFWKES